MKYFILLLFLFLFLLKICNYRKEDFKSKYCDRPNYEPNKINKKFLLNNNCYAYALNNFSDKRTKKTQPGVFSNIPKIKKKKKYYTCENFNRRILKDNNLSYKLDDNNEDCLCNFYKIALFIDNTENNLDYHFYREEYEHNSDKSFWSHKAGNYFANNKDASGNLILDPTLSDRDFSKLKNFKHNYKKFCANYCIKTNNIK